MHKAKTNDTKIKDVVICTEPLDIVQSTDTTEINKNAETDVILNEDEINTLATLVNLEAGVESYECQKDVASVVIDGKLDIRKNPELFEKLIGKE